MYCPEDKRDEKTGGIFIKVRKGRMQIGIKKREHSDAADQE